MPIYQFENRCPILDATRYVAPGVLLAGAELTQSAQSYQARAERFRVSLVRVDG